MQTKDFSTSAIKSHTLPLLSSLTSKLQNLRNSKPVYKFEELLFSFGLRIGIISKTNLSSRAGLKPNGKITRPLLLLAALILLLIVGRSIIFPGRNGIAGVKTDKLSVQPPYKTLQLNRDFVFPIRGEGSVETGMVIKYTIQQIDLADEIIIKGKKAGAVEGRTFFIITLKVTNDENVGIEIDTRDYIRLAVGTSEDRLAAEMHNDPVEVQPLSTKPTRIAFPIDEGETHYRLFVGEIKGDKEAIDINL